jgi:hypothetical protein
LANSPVRDQAAPLITRYARRLESSLIQGLGVGQPDLNFQFNPETGQVSLALSEEKMSSLNRQQRIRANTALNRSQQSVNSLIVQLAHINGSTDYPQFALMIAEALESIDE